MYPDADFTTSIMTLSAWDRTLGWFINTGSKTEYEIAIDSTSWGNFKNSEYTISTGEYEDSPLVKLKGEAESLKTGVSDLFCVNNIYDLAGNFDGCVHHPPRRCVHAIRRWDNIRTLLFHKPLRHDIS